MERILIVEDTVLIAELERDYLEANGYEVDIAEDGIKGMQLYREKEYDLILLDIMLPGISGFDMCREIRKEKFIPIIMVTAKKEDVDKIRGLGLGADDYIVKPFSPAELVARVKAHISIHKALLAHSVPHKESQLDFGRLKIAPQSHRVFVDGKEVSFPNKEYELLLLLAENPNIVFSKEQIYDRIWGMNALGDTKTVMVHINRIRDKVEKNPAKPEYIETVWGVGYRFACP